MAINDEVQDFEELNPLELLEEAEQEEEGLESDALDNNSFESVNASNLFPKTFVSINHKPNISYDIKNSKHFVLSGVAVCDNTTLAVDGTQTETTLNSFVFDPNALHKRVCVRVWAAGTYTTDDATATVALNLKTSSATLHTISTTGATVGGVPWFIDCRFIVTEIGSSGTVESFAHAQTNNVNKDSSNTTTLSFNTVTNQTLSLTATWSSGSAGDSITIRQWIVEILN